MVILSQDPEESPGGRSSKPRPGKLPSGLGDRLAASSICFASEAIGTRGVLCCVWEAEMAM